jgi:hypothetical protein
MAEFQDLVVSLRRAEQQLEGQLQGVRAAISSLESGSAALPVAPGRGRGRTRASGNGVVRRRRKLSAAARKAISDAQKKRWAKQKAAAAKK